MWKIDGNRWEKIVYTYFHEKHNIKMLFVYLFQEEGAHDCTVLENPYIFYEMVCVIKLKSGGG